MDNKRITLGIGIVLAVLVAFAAPAAADAEVYLEPDPSTVSVAPGESVTIQVMAYVDGSENCLRSFQVGVAFDPTVVNITDSTNPAKPGGGNWWNIVHGHSWWDDPSGPEGAWIYTTGMNLPGHQPTPITVPLTNFTIEGISSGTSPLNFTHELIFEPLGESMLFDCGYLVIEPTTWVNNEIKCVGSSETFEKELVLGWNLISLPLAPENNSTSAVLGNDTIVYDKVYRYDATSKEFEGATTGTMDPGIGYFVNITTAGIWSYEGHSYVEMSIDLKQGLNLVGWVNETGSALPDALDSIAGEYNYVARWDATSPSYEVYDANAPPGVPEFTDFETMERGNGYWIAAKEGCKLTAS